MGAGAGQVRIHDLKRLNVKAGQSLNGVARLDCGILFSTYDMLISGGKQTAASKSKAQAASDAELLAGRFEDPGKKEFGMFSLLDHAAAVLALCLWL